jgi:hypothetical protein
LLCAPAAGIIAAAKGDFGTSRWQLWNESYTSYRAPLRDNFDFRMTRCDCREMALSGHPTVDRQCPLLPRPRSGVNVLVVMPAHSCSQNGVASLAYGGHPRL